MQVLYTAVVAIANPETLQYYKPLTDNQRIIVKILNDDQLIISDNVTFENELVKLRCEKKIIKDEAMTFYRKNNLEFSEIHKFDIQLKNKKLMLIIYIAGHVSNPLVIKGEEI